MGPRTVHSRLDPFIPVILESNRIAASLDIIRDVAERLKLPQNVERAAASVKTHTRLPKGFSWQPHSISQGFGGLALLWGYMDACFPDAGWDRVGRTHIELAVRAIERLPHVSFGLCSGLSGLAFAVEYLSRDGARYKNLLSRLENVVIPQAVNLADSVLCRKSGLDVFEFDVISGLAGIGRYLLLRRRSQEASRALTHVLRALVYLSGSENGLPRWHTPRQFMRDETSAKLYPNGNLNCGLAHGSPGILALLALAEIAGQRVERMEEAITVLAEWLAEHLIEDEWGVNWPTSIPLSMDLQPMEIKRTSDAASPDRTVYRFSRSAWCYGSPGVARSLWLAGKALAKPEYQRLAVEAMLAVYRRPVAARRIDSPTFCHGVAGLLQITLRFARDTELPIFYQSAELLSDQLRLQYQRDSLVGFLNIEPGGTRVEQPGLLDGSAGSAISLLAACTEVPPDWDALFLLS